MCTLMSWVSVPLLSLISCVSLGERLSLSDSCFYLFIYLFIYLFNVSVEPHQQHMEVPRLGVESQL